VLLLSSSSSSSPVITELEDFLIANRSEYLANASRFNYTMEQKEYNNQLTQRLLEYASNCGYGNLLELKEFNTFTSLRDRVRCYYKSFVQSYRRREQRRQKREEQQQQQRTIKLQKSSKK
jgi:hypothetical protein